VRIAAVIVHDLIRRIAPAFIQRGRRSLERAPACTHAVLAVGESVLGSQRGTLIILGARSGHRRANGSRIRLRGRAVFFRRTAGVIRRRRAGGIIGRAYDPKVGARRVAAGGRGGIGRVVARPKGAQRRGRRVEEGPGAEGPVAEAPAEGLLRRAAYGEFRDGMATVGRAASTARHGRRIGIGVIVNALIHAGLGGLCQGEREHGEG
jgi:hypothetical protein